MQQECATYAKKREVLRKVKGHQPSNDEWTLILMCVLSANKLSDNLVPYIRPVCLIPFDYRIMGTELPRNLILVREIVQILPIVEHKRVHQLRTLSLCSTAGACVM